MQGPDLNDLIPNAAQAHDLSQPQQPPQMSGLMVNGAVWTIKELEQLSDSDFREFFLGVVIGLMGGHYVSARAMEAAEEEPMMGADSSLGATAEVLKAEDKK